MRVWGYADPRLLNRKHLLGEHNEIHILLKSGWPNHPDSQFKRFGSTKSKLNRDAMTRSLDQAADYWLGIRWLRLRHELLRIEMLSRFGLKHTHDRHATPIEMTMTDLDGWIFIKAYGYQVLRTETNGCRPFDIDTAFEAFMAHLGFPPTRMDHDKPWDRDRMTAQEYVTLGDRWDLKVHKLGKWIDFGSNPVEAIDGYNDYKRRQAQEA